MTSQDASELIRKRRSIYPAQYSEAKVADQVIEEMLENANWAPTHRLTEPWRFVVFADDGLKALGEFQSGLYKKVATQRGDFDEIKFDKLLKKPLKASHIIAIGMIRDPKGSVPEIEEIESVAAAVQNMYLTATAHGVGCYWGTGGVTYFEEAAEEFGFDKLLGFLYVGSPKGEWPVGKRGDIGEKVEWFRSA